MSPLKFFTRIHAYLSYVIKAFSSSLSYDKLLTYHVMHNPGGQSDGSLVVQADAPDHSYNYLYQDLTHAPYNGWATKYIDPPAEAWVRILTEAEARAAIKAINRLYRRQKLFQVWYVMCQPFAKLQYQAPYGYWVVYDPCAGLYADSILTQAVRRTHDLLKRGSIRLTSDPYAFLHQAPAAAERIYTLHTTWANRVSNYRDDQGQLVMGVVLPVGEPVFLDGPLLQELMTNVHSGFPADVTVGSVTFVPPVYDKYHQLMSQRVTLVWDYDDEDEYEDLD